MPTHKDLPDSYLRGKKRRGPAAWSTGTLVGVILGLGIVAGIGGGLLLSGGSGAAAGTPPPADHAARVAHRRRRTERHTRHKVNQAKRAVVHTAPRPKPSVPKPSAPTPSAPTPPVPRPVPARPYLLAVGVSVRGHGRAADLIVTGAGHGITARSRSPVRLAISSDSHYGAPLRSWAVLDRGEIRSRVLITGQRYGYCFAQAAGDGYAATRACGTSSWHQLVNGTRVPDGAPLTTYVRFLAP